MLKTAKLAVAVAEPVCCYRYVPELRNLQKIRGKSFTCFLVNEIECPCLFGSRWENLKETFTQINREVQQNDLELVRN